MKKKNTKKYLFLIAIVIIILFVIQYVEGEIINNLNSEIVSSSSTLILEQNNVLSANINLDYMDLNVLENYSDLEDLKSGDNYHLHNPMYSEVIDFINQDNSDSIKRMIVNAKNIGIRCAYVMIYVGDRWGVYEPETGYFYVQEGEMYPLIGFNTIDQGMLYFESVTDYQVIPSEGKFYADCVVGNPYLLDRSDFITHILVAW